MALTTKQVKDLNKMNKAAQNVNLGDLLEDKSPVGHTHTGTEVKMTGYIKPEETSLISDADNVNVAIGKLEKRIESLPEGTIIPSATLTEIGGVKKAAAVAEAAGENVTAAEFKALLDALKAAGIM